MALCLRRDVFTTAYYELFYQTVVCSIQRMKCTCTVYILYSLQGSTGTYKYGMIGWIQHKISSSENQTPMQLYIMEMLRNAHSGHTMSNEVYGPLNQVYIFFCSKYMHFSSLSPSKNYLWQKITKCFK